MSAHPWFCIRSCVATLRYMQQYCFTTALFIYLVDCCLAVPHQLLENDKYRVVMQALRPFIVTKNNVQFTSDAEYYNDLQLTISPAFSA
jgi:hypothetical protein